MFISGEPSRSVQRAYQFIPTKLTDFNPYHHWLIILHRLKWRKPESIMPIRMGCFYQVSEEEMLS